MTPLPRLPSLSSLFFFFLSFFIYLVLGHAQSNPLAAILPISLHPTYNTLYTVSLRLGTPPTTKIIKLALDLSNSNLWTSSCNDKSSRSHVSCNSPVCAISRTCNAFVCGGSSCQTCDNSPPFSSSLCTNNTCVVDITNPFIKTTTMAELWQDSLLLDQTDGSNLIAKPLLLADSFPIACDDYLLVNYSLPAPGIKGFTALSRAQLAMPTQLSRKLGFSPTFAYCLPSNSNAPGPLFFGDPSSYTFNSGMNASFYLTTHTPLLTVREQPDEYFIAVSQINVGDSKLGINGALLNVKKGKGGTRFSTTTRYTQLEPSIFKALSETYTAKAAQMGIPRVPAVAPFQTCFDWTKVTGTHGDNAVPQINLILAGKNKKTVWEISGRNSVVPASSTALCLAFEETGEYERQSIIVGTFQQQDRLMRFDLASNVLSFTPNLNPMLSSCSNFNFTSGT